MRYYLVSPFFIYRRTNIMLVCVSCKRPMKCIKNGVGVDYQYSHVYAGDVFQCPECLSSIISTNNNASYDADYKFFDYYLPMKTNQISEVSAEDINKILVENFASNPEDLKNLRKE